MVIAADFRKRLDESWASIDDVRREILVKMAEALCQEPIILANPDSEFASNEDFMARFTSRILIHHATSTQLLRKEAFEHQFREACAAAGWSAALGASMTYPGADIVVNGGGISLKTEAAPSGISDKHIHISKFRESALAKGFSEPRQYAEYIQTYVMPHLAGYERVLMLRGKELKPSTLQKRTGVKSTLSGGVPLSDAPSGSSETATQPPQVKYALVEIPIHLLRQMGELTADDFTVVKRRNTSARATVYAEANCPAYEVYFDGSDDKIQLQKLDLSLCMLHASWILQPAAV